MTWLPATILLGLGTFAATNLDDILILTLFFAQVNGDFRKRHVVAGQYLGFTFLLGVSLVGYWGGQVVPSTWIGLLGFAPIFLGISKLRRLKNAPGAVESPPTAVIPPTASPASLLFSRQMVMVTAVTMANGSDNIGVYLPLFARSSASQLTSLLIVYFILVVLWCAVAYHLARTPLVTVTLTRYGDALIPFVFMGIGVAMLIESGAASMLLSWLAAG